MLTEGATPQKVAPSVFLPVTRPWSREAVAGAIIASDVPRRLVLLLDAPGCESWVDAFPGFQVEVHETGNPVPPAGRLERRARHLVMRRLSQELTAHLGRVLYLEDDTIVPPTVWATLSRHLDAGARAASGVQRSRYDRQTLGVWRCGEYFYPERISSAQAVGHYCLLTTGVAYAEAPIEPRHREAIDIAHTKHLAPIIVDPAAWCGHLLETGEVLW